MHGIHSDNECNEMIPYAIVASKERDSLLLLSHSLFDWVDTQVLLKQHGLMKIARRPGFSSAEPHPSYQVSVSWG